MDYESKMMSSLLYGGHWDAGNNLYVGQIVYNLPWEDLIES